MKTPRRKRKPFIPPPPILVTFEARLRNGALKLGKCVAVEVRP